MLDLSRIPLRTLVLPAFALAIALLLVARGAGAAEPYEAFYGKYEGTAISDEPGSELSPRDIRISIGPRGKGFRAEWVVVTRKSDGRVKRTDYAIDFLPTRRDGIYRSAMRNDVFGQAVPLDPMAGDPYVWGRVEGRTLTIYALIVTEAGGYEMQTYERTLTAEGMDLVYSRVRDGEVLRTLRGTLLKIR